MSIFTREELETVIRHPKRFYDAFDALNAIRKVYPDGDHTTELLVMYDLAFALGVNAERDKRHDKDSN